MAEDWRRYLDATIEELFPRMVEIRRHLHAHPEVSGAEQETSFFLYQMLGDAGFDVRMGPEGCGVVADSRAGNATTGDPSAGDPSAGDTSAGNSSAGGIIAIRADIDALRIHDSKQVPYRSRRDGVMHACGHDAHTAIGLGTVLALRRLQTAGQLPCELPIRGIFQPAEETSEGARAMIDVGVLEKVDAVLALHMDPTRDVGEIGVRAGVLTANCDEMCIGIRGRGGHAARPHETVDPIAAAAQLINALYLYIPRVTDSQDAVVVTIGEIRGGEHANVIPEAVELRGTIRSLDRTVRRKTMEHICRLAEGIAKTTETKVDVHFGLSSDSVVNDAHLVRLVREAGREILGVDGVQEIPRPSMGSEDFSYYLNHVPGVMFRLGCRSEQAGGSPLHSSSFDIDEASLAIGARILARAAIYQKLQDP